MRQCRRVNSAQAHAAKSRRHPPTRKIIPHPLRQFDRAARTTLRVRRSRHPPRTNLRATHPHPLPSPPTHAMWRRRATKVCRIHPTRREWPHPRQTQTPAIAPPHLWRQIDPDQCACNRRIRTDTYPPRCAPCDSTKNFRAPRPRPSWKYLA